MDQIKEKTSNLKYKLEIDEFIKMFMDEDIDYGKAIKEFTTNNKIHLSAMLLQCLGYEGKFRIQQHNFKRFLKSNKISLLELTSSDPDIKNYPTIQDEMKLLKPNVKATRKWLIIEPREFKKVIMKLNTKHGDRIREYYLCLEELLILYSEYCMYFKQITTLEHKLEQIQIYS